MSSTRNAQLIIVQLSGSRRRRAYPSRFLNTHRARRCGLPVSFGRLVPSTRRCGVIGTELGSLDAFTTSASSAATPRQPRLRTVNGAKGKNCEACGGIGTFGPARHWLRPPGFAHPVSKEEGTSPDDQPTRSYATRAKLTMHTPMDHAKWTNLGDYLRVYYTRQHLLVTNRGPREEGYTYCTSCGLIEPTALPKGSVAAAHRKPYPRSQR